MFDLLITIVFGCRVTEIVMTPDDRTAMDYCLDCASWWAHCGHDSTATNNSASPQLQPRISCSSLGIGP